MDQAEETTPKGEAPLRIGTRGSDLALYQARRVAALIEERLGRKTALVTIETHGDRDGRSPIETMGEVGVFTKEIERALLAGRIDLAVHSLKDLPTRLPEGLALAAVPERADPGDVLIARAPLERLEPGARVGTSSRRRRAQIEEARPDLCCEEVRGNVPTRIEKCRRGDYDAIVLARAGIERLGLSIPSGEDVDGGGAATKAGEPGLRRFDLPPGRFLPAPGQGALAVETRAEDAAILKPLDDPAIAAAVGAERALLRLVEGGCSVPLGAHARILGDGRVELAAVLAAPGRLRRALVRRSMPLTAAALAFRILKPDPEPIAAAGLEGKRIVLTRDDPDLAAALAEAGASVRTAPAVEIVPLIPAPALPPSRWTLVASAKTAPLVRGAALGRVGAIGPGTAEALARVGIPIELMAERADGAGLAEAFLALDEPRGTSVLLPGAKEARPELRERLEAAGYDVRPVALYETRPLRPDLGGAELVVFASPSAVHAAVGNPGGGGAAATGGPSALPAAVAIGPATAAAASRAGFKVTVAERPTTGGLVFAIERALGGHTRRIRP